jgi:hypothetical protein
MHTTTKDFKVLSVLSQFIFQTIPEIVLLIEQMQKLGIQIIPCFIQVQKLDDAQARVLT